MRTRCMKWLPLALASASFGCAEMEGDVGQQDDEAIVTENGLRTIQRPPRHQRPLASTNGLATAERPVEHGRPDDDRRGAQPGRVPRTLRAARDRVDHQGQLHVPGTARPGARSGSTAPATRTARRSSPPACSRTSTRPACTSRSGSWPRTQAVGWGQDPEFPNQEGGVLRQRLHARRARHRPDQGADVLLHGREVQREPAPGPRRRDADQPALRQPVRQHLRRRARGSHAAPPPTTRTRPHGFKACNGWNNVVTVWRQNTATTTTTSSGSSGGSGFRWR